MRNGARALCLLLVTIAGGVHAQTLSSKVGVVRMSGRANLDYGIVQIVLPATVTIPGANCNVPDGTGGPTTYNNRVFAIFSGTSVQGVSTLQSYLAMALSAQAQDTALQFVYDPASCVAGYGITMTVMSLTTPSN